MAAEYAKKKNDELIALCKERGLPHSGKKADLVKRLEDSDSNVPEETAAAKPAIEDEIDWDDEPTADTAKAATTEADANAMEAGGVGAVKNPVDVPNQELAVDPAKTDDLTVAAAPEADASAVDEQAPPPAEEKSFSSFFSSAGGAACASVFGSSVLGAAATVRSSVLAGSTASS